MPLLCAVFAFLSLSACNKIVYTAKQSENLRETIDFIQYWYCKNFDETDWNLHISNLQKSGYRSIILQSTTKFDSDGFIKTQSDGNCFPTETVKKLLAVAERLDFGVYLGLAASDLWWKTDLYKEQCERWGKYQAETAAMVYSAASGYKCFEGFYMPFEVYTNTFWYEKYWAKTFNVLIEKLNSLAPQYPLICSPYKSSLYRMNKNSIYSFAVRFIDNINFRAYDIIAPQDGSGRASSDFDKKSEQNVDDFLSAFYTASKKKAKCRFGVNIEFFSKEKGEFATAARIAKQREIANRYADIILSFSYSDYYAPKIVKNT